MTDSRVSLRRKTAQLQRRKKHVKKNLFGTAERPRLVVYRSSRHIYAQIVDDVNRRTLFGCSTQTPALKERVAAAKTKIEKAKIVGEHIAALSKEKGVAVVCFDRNGRRYHGRVKALAEGARAGGLVF